MKIILSISLITTALFMAGCVQKSSEKKDQAANNPEIKVLHEIELSEPAAEQALVQKRLSKDQKTSRAASGVSYKAKPYHQAKGPTMMFTLPPANYLEKSINEKYDHRKNNGVLIVNEQPVSTFSVDVDTASYTNVRRILNHGTLPQQDAVRVEELINYFSYGYPAPTEQPFSVYSEIGPSP